MIKARYFFIFCFVFLFIGMYLYKKNLPPRPQVHAVGNFVTQFFSRTNEKLIPDIVEVEKYTIGINLFLDRNYSNTIVSTNFEDCYVIKLPRHFSSDIEFFTHEPCKIFRFVSLRNDNTIYTNWNKIHTPVKITALSCNHNYVVSKDYPKGMVSLPSGGPYSADPILVKLSSKKNWRDIIQFISVTSKESSN